MLPHLVMAQPLGFSTPPLWELVEQYQAQCPPLLCAEVPLQKKALNRNQLRRWSPEQRQRLYAITKDQVRNIWPDTILEGDHYTITNPRLDQVVGLWFTHANQVQELVGYWILFSTEAWDLSTCQIDRFNREELSQCQYGRIQEALFVDTQLTASQIDKYQFARFFVP